MKNRTFENNGKTYKRISKKAARNAYQNGSTVIICPCHLYPFNKWGIAHKMNRKYREEFVIDETGVINDFNNSVNSFEYYNCNSATGNYTAFYMEV